MLYFLEGVWGLVSSLWAQNEDDDQYFMGIYDDIFVHQSFRWDCGIATTSMVLLWCKIVDPIGINEAPLEFQDGTPLWTIDLYVFLRERGVTCTMSTLAKGVEPALNDIEWYKEHLDKDRERVEAKFALADRNQWTIDDAMSTDELAGVLLDKRYANNDDTATAQGKDEDDGKERVAIVLVNINNLVPRAGVDPSKYSGHYVLLLSYSPRSDEFIYLDPAKSTSAAKRVSREALHHSRQAVGTDMDLIVCSRNQLQLPQL
jgi:hypothetical protein